MTDHVCYDGVAKFITTESEVYSVHYCPEGGHLMAKSTSKTILFSTTRHDKKVHQHPVAVFNNATDAKHYLTYLKLAHRAGDAEAVKALDPQTLFTEDGAIAGDTKWSMVEVIYAPEANFPDEDDETPATAAS